GRTRGTQAWARGRVWSAVNISKASRWIPLGRGLVRAYSNKSSTSIQSFADTSTHLQTGAAKRGLSGDRAHDPTTFPESYTIPQELPACRSTAYEWRRIDQSLPTF